MTDFWNRCNWEPCPNRVLLHQFCDAVGATPHQMRIFRQNNRKKHMGMAWASMYGAMDPAFINQVLGQMPGAGLMGGMPPGMPPMTGMPGMPGMPGLPMMPGMTGMTGMSGAAGAMGMQAMHGMVPGMAGMDPAAMMGMSMGMGVPPELGLAPSMMAPLPNGMQAPLPMGQLSSGLPLDLPGNDDSIQKLPDDAGAKDGWVTTDTGQSMQQAISHER